MEIGIVGLPYAGKTTIFQTLLKHKPTDTSGGRQSAERGIVKVPDPRVDRLTEMFNPKKKVNSVIEYIKVQGLEGDDNQHQGLPAQFIANVKTVDALLVVIRDFENEYYPHPLDRVDPEKDMDFINGEFLLSDLGIVETRSEKLEKMIMKTKEDRDIRELAMLKRFREQLEQEKPLRELEFSEDDKRMMKGFQFITAKPLLYLINISEEKIAQAPEIEKKFSRFLSDNCVLTSLSAEIEKEISELDEEDARIFMEDLGITEPALDKLIRTSYELLGLISFFTVGDDECRAWTIEEGTVAQKAAGTIHSDLEKGFIRAETVHYDELIALGSLNACKEKGVLRLEGKEYRVKDGDIISVRFNV